MARLALAVLLLSLPALAEEGLPDFIPLKTHQRTFNNHHDFALKDGHVWFRPRRFTLSDPPAPWKLLGKNGLPFRANGDIRGDPTRIGEISADATGLVAVGEDGRIYDGELDAHDNVLWQYEWGWPWRVMPQPVFLPPAAERRDWAYSLLNQEGSYSEDIDGNPHTIKRIDTVYMLAKDGRAFRYDDPWLPPNPFEFWIAGPKRGAFAAVSFSASGSTLFVMDRTGALYTRLVDFDTLGGNPGITYSYERKRLPTQPEDATHALRGDVPLFYDVRSLPAEDWRAQPPIPGRFTTLLTILQNGKGNAARELRVEGADADGNTGYWSKPLYGGAWSFVKTGLATTGDWVDPSAPPEDVKSLDEDLTGTARMYPPRDGAPVSLRAELKGFNTCFEPMMLRLFPEEGAPLDVTLHLRPDVFPLTAQAPKRLLGVLMPPAPQADEEAGHKRLRALLGTLVIQDVYVVISKDQVEIQTNPNARTDGRRYRMTFRRGP